MRPLTAIPVNNQPQPQVSSWALPMWRGSLPMAQFSNAPISGQGRSIVVPGTHPRAALSASPSRYGGAPPPPVSAPALTNTVNYSIHGGSRTSLSSSPTMTPMSSSASLPKLDIHHALKAQICTSARSLQSLTPVTSVGPSTPMSSTKPPSRTSLRSNASSTLRVSLGKTSQTATSTPFSSMSCPLGQGKAAAHETTTELGQPPRSHLYETTTELRQSADATTQYSPPLSDDDLSPRVETSEPQYQDTEQITTDTACGEAKLEEDTKSEKESITLHSPHRPHENLSWLSVFETSKEDTDKNNVMSPKAQEAVDNWQKYVVMPSNISVHEEIITSSHVTPREHKINLTVSEVPLENASKNNKAEEDYSEKGKMTDDTDEEPSPWVPIGIGSALVCVLLLL